MVKNYGNLSLIPSTHGTPDQRVPVPLLAPLATHTYAPKFTKHTHTYTKTNNVTVPFEEQEKDLKLPVTKWKEIMKTRQNETKQEMKKKRIRKAEFVV